MASGAVHPKVRLRRRRALVAVALGAMLAGGGSLAAGADGGLTVTPSSGAPGSSYTVSVDCGEFPLIYQGNTQDASVQGTVGSYGSDQVSMVSPSVWQATETAGDTDRRYWATCGQATVGTGYFDAEAPHLWFGPRPQNIFSERDPKTTVEGTDCPPGTQANGTIVYEGDIALPFTADIDEHGDWSVDLPATVGETEMTVYASCGSVEYPLLVATTTPTSTPVTTPTSSPTTTPGSTPVTTPPQAPPASPQPGSTTYTG